ncbi:MAG: hypothetical protein AAGD07_22795 [Planctomycetota bacterium]
MRISTLGILLVSAGILAALPFRRWSSFDKTGLDQTEKSVDVLGTASFASPRPGISSLVYDRFEPLPGEGPIKPPVRRVSASIQTSADTDSSSTVLTWRRHAPIPSAVPVRPRRDVTLPLTYEDLAVPLEPTHYRETPFDALSTVHNRYATKAVTNATSDPPLHANDGPSQDWQPAVAIQQDGATGERVSSENVARGARPASRREPTSRRGNAVKELPPSAVPSVAGQPSGDLLPSLPRATTETRLPPAGQIRHWIRQP